MNRPVTPADVMIGGFLLTAACYGAWLFALGVVDAIERIRAARADQLARRRCANGIAAAKWDPVAMQQLAPHSVETRRR